MQAENETNVSFGRKLQELIEGREMSKAAFAKALGVSHVAVGNYVKGRVPKATILQRISDFFGIPSSVLLSTDHPNDPDKDWTKSSDPEKELAVAGYWAEKKRDESIKFRVIDQGEAIETNVSYRSPLPTQPLPTKILLKRPKQREIQKLLPHLRSVNDVEKVVLACLPPELANSAFVERLTPTCAYYLEEACFTLAFGVDDAPRILRQLRGDEASEMLKSAGLTMEWDYDTEGTSLIPRNQLNLED